MKNFYLHLSFAFLATVSMSCSDNIGDCVTILNPSCYHILTPPFTGNYSFNCDIPEFSVIPISFGGLTYGEDCLDVAPYDLARIKFKVHCAGTYYADPPNCQIPSGAWTLYSSEEFTMTIRTNDYTASVFNLSLGECGCKPLSSF